MTPCRRGIAQWPDGFSFVFYQLPHAWHCVCCRGGAEAAAAAAAERAADPAEADLLQNLPEKLDEFGRDENVELREDMSRRARKRVAQYSNPPAQPQVLSCSFCLILVPLSQACLRVLSVSIVVWSVGRWQCTPKV